jgi:hypothetical protein
LEKSVSKIESSVTTHPDCNCEGADTFCFCNAPEEPPVFPSEPPYLPPIEDGCCGEDCDCDGSCGDNCKCKEDKACVCGDKDCEAKEAKIVVKRKTKMRKVYHVVPAPEKGWLVKEEKNKNPSARADRKTDAVKRAKELAKKAKLGQVIVHKKNGQIQTEYTYGDDPRSTKG